MHGTQFLSKITEIQGNAGFWSTFLFFYLDGTIHFQNGRYCRLLFIVHNVPGQEPLLGMVCKPHPRSSEMKCLCCLSYLCCHLDKTVGVAWARVAVPENCCAEAMGDQGGGAYPLAPHPHLSWAVGGGGALALRAHGAHLLHQSTRKRPHCPVHRHQQRHKQQNTKTLCSCVGDSHFPMHPFNSATPERGPHRFDKRHR